jgi:hypothetical protein
VIIAGTRDPGLGIRDSGFGIRDSNSDRAERTTPMEVVLPLCAKLFAERMTSVSSCNKLCGWLA